MRPAVKWAGIGLVGLAGAVGIAATVLYVRGGARLSRVYDVPVTNLAVPSEERAVARGRHLSEAVTLCQGCHGEDLGGDVLFDEPGIATAYASNLTAGQGGVGASYSDQDFVRAIRHGVNREGRGIVVMHSDAYQKLSESDLGSIIAYVRSVPPVDKESPNTEVSPIGRILIGLGLFDLESMPFIPAEVIDHTSPVPVAPAAGVTREYGGYLVAIALCGMCHGSDLRGGGPIEPGAPEGPDITVYGMTGGWSGEQFISTIRTGVTPYGKTLNSEAMPATVYAKMTDDELLAIAEYLGSMAPN